MTGLAPVLIRDDGVEFCWSTSGKSPTHSRRASMCSRTANLLRRSCNSANSRISGVLFRFSLVPLCPLDAIQPSFNGYRLHVIESVIPPARKNPLVRMRKSFCFRPLAFIDKAAQILRRMGILTAKVEHQFTKKSGFAVHSPLGGLHVERWNEFRYAEIVLRASCCHRVTLCTGRSGIHLRRASVSLSGLIGFVR